MSALADAVLPLIRTRADLHWRSAASAHGRQMHVAVDILEAAASAGADAGEMYTVTHRALASSVTVIARADDSSGIIGDTCGVCWISTRGLLPARRCQGSGSPDG